MEPLELTITNIENDCKYSVKNNKEDTIKHYLRSVLQQD